MTGKTLKVVSLIKVRYNEVDSMNVVWHGHYLKYFEDGRNDFGTKYDIDYLKIHKEGFFAPVVKINCEYKRPCTFGDTVRVETTYRDTEAMKISFEYEIIFPGYTKMLN